MARPCIDRKIVLRRDKYLHQMGCGPVLTKQAAQDRPEVFAELDCSQLSCGFLADLVGFSNGGFSHRYDFPNCHWSTGYYIWSLPDALQQ